VYDTAESCACRVPQLSPAKHTAPPVERGLGVRERVRIRVGLLRGLHTLRVAHIIYARTAASAAMHRPKPKVAPTRAAAPVGLVSTGGVPTLWTGGGLVSTGGVPTLWTGGGLGGGGEGGGGEGGGGEGDGVEGDGDEPVHDELPMVAAHHVHRAHARARQPCGQHGGYRVRAPLVPRHCASGQMSHRGRMRTSPS
jgi:hypothetical protein